MTLTVTDAILDNVLRRVSDGSDPLGVGTGMARTQSGDRVEKVVTAALTGLTSIQANAVEKALRTEAPRDSARIDLATVDLLVDHGLDPLAVVWLASVDDGLSIHDEDLDIVIEFSGEPFDATTRVGESAFWNAGCWLTIPGLPDTIVTASKDRMLREIVSHPVLDRHPMVVRDAQVSMNQYARFVCRRDVWIMHAWGQRRPELMSHLAHIHHLVDGHHRMVAP